MSPNKIKIGICLENTTLNNLDFDYESVKMNDVNHVLRRLSEAKDRHHHEIEWLSKLHELDSSLELEKTRFLKLHKIMKAVTKKDNNRGFFGFLNTSFNKVENDLQACKNLAEKYIQAAKSSMFNFGEFYTLVKSVIERRSNTARIQGHCVDSKVIEFNYLKYSLDDFRLRIVEEFDFESENGTAVGGLWRQLGSDGAVWLYSHSDSYKHQCIWYRFEVARPSRGKGTISIDTYVPIGFAEDPSEYPVAESSAYKRAGWNTAIIDVRSASLTNTWNLSHSENSSFGVTIGKNVGATTTYQTGEQVTATEQTGRSSQIGNANTEGKQTTWGYSFSTGESESETKSSVVGTNSSSGSSVGRSSGKSNASSEGTSYGASQNQNRGICKGVSTADGESIQYSTVHFGIDYSVGNRRLFENWCDANREKAREIRNVHSGLEKLADRVIEQSDVFLRFNEPTSVGDPNQKLRSLILSGLDD